MFFVIFIIINASYEVKGGEECVRIVAEIVLKTAQYSIRIENKTPYIKRNKLGNVQLSVGANTILFPKVERKLILGNRMVLTQPYECHKKINNRPISP